MRLRTVLGSVALLSSMVAAAPAVATPAVVAAPAHHYTPVVVKVSGHACKKTVINGIIDNDTSIGTAYCGKSETFLRLKSGHLSYFRLPKRYGQHTTAANISSNGYVALLDSKTKSGPQTSYLLAPADSGFAVLKDPAAGHHSTIVESVNRDGEAVGIACLNARCTKESSWAWEDGSFLPFRLHVAGAHDVNLTAVTDTGLLDGWFYDRKGVAHGFQVSKAGRVHIINIRDAGHKAGEGTFVEAGSSNGSVVGEVVGRQFSESGFALIHHSTHLINITPLGSKTYFNTQILAVNDHGVTGGYAYLPHRPGFFRAFIDHV
jgi:hypothetical protein